MFRPNYTRGSRVFDACCEFQSYKCKCIQVCCTGNSNNLGQYWGDAIFRNGEILLVKFWTRLSMLWPQFTGWLYSWKTHALLKRHKEYLADPIQCQPWIENCGAQMLCWGTFRPRGAQIPATITHSLPGSKSYQRQTPVCAYRLELP